MLNVFTAQYKYKGEDRRDVTIKSSSPPWNIFAPTWDMVMRFTKGPKDRTAKRLYETEYRQILVRALETDGERILTLINSNKTRVLVCFCKSGEFCHRVLLAKHLASLGAIYHCELDCELAVQK